MAKKGSKQKESETILEPKKVKHMQRKSIQ